MKPFVVMTELHVDDRGTVYCPFDHNGDGDVGEIKRTYVVHNWEKGRIRAWHGHRRGWTGLHVIHGSAKIVAKIIEPESGDDTPWLLHASRNPSVSVVLSDKSPGIFWVPPGWYNGHVSLEDNTKILVYSTHTFEEVKKDDIRCSLDPNHIKKYFEVKNR
jgi:dTDP-4-dehydrorhamnose 3,5-epimerase-like enzyme